MKPILILIAAALVLIVGYLIYTKTTPVVEPVSYVPKEALTIIATDLSIPWDIAFLDDGLLVTERTGQVQLIRNDGTRKEIAVEGVAKKGEGGLLGIVLHPEFSRNAYIYLYMSSPSGDGTVNRVVRYTYKDETLMEDRVIIDNIPGAIYHDGGRMEFGPDGMLYVTTGDATKSSIAQDLNSRGGKILRLREDGSIPTDNPFGSAVYSYGHRNPQGLAWDDEKRLWSTEHGRSGITSGLDEINLVTAGANYGWPTIEGDKTADGMQKPARHSGASTTWAPASAVFLNGSLYFGGLKGEAFYEAVLEGDTVTEVKEHFKGTYGRIRTVRLSPDGYLYLTTSNTDGRGNAAKGDDRIIRIDPEAL